jgi:hypothetical protein
MQFDGASYISVPNAASLNPTTAQLTMSFWIRVDDFTNVWSGIINKDGLVGAYDGCGADRQYTVWLNQALYFGQDSSGDNGCAHYLLTKPVGAKGKWLHYVGIVDKVKHLQSIYINGVLNAKIVDSYISFNINNHDLIIGSSEEELNNVPFKGALDEIRLYNRALTATEIKALYNQAIPVNGTIKSMAAHTVTCLNATTAQSITIPASKVTAYDCEAKGLSIKPQDHITITIDGNAQ